jgi:hypothetical protein
LEGEIMSSLPKDWTFVLPEDESFAEPRAAEAELTGVAAEGADRFAIAGVPVRALVGEMELGSLNPAGKPVQLDAAMLEADASFGSLVVERRHYNAATGEYVPKRKMLMKYAAPACIGMWAQQPYLAETGCLRYVLTAMHTDQAAPGAAVG